MFQYVDGDIICINETHLKRTDAVELPCYVWFGYNRQAQHVRANRSSGGVGIFIKNSVMQEYQVLVVDREVDGILILKLEHKVSK